MKRRLIAGGLVAGIGGAIAATLGLDGFLLLMAGAVTIVCALAVAGIFDA